MPFLLALSMALTQPQVPAAPKSGQMCATGTVQEIEVDEKLRIYLTIGNKIFLVYDDRYYGTNSGNSIYNIAMSAFLAGANVELFDSSYECKRFDFITIKWLGTGATAAKSPSKYDRE